MSKPRQIRYDPRKTAPTIDRFHKSKAFHRGIMGPRGSAKSTGCCWEIFRRSQQQKSSPHDKIRRTRFAIVRNCYDDQTEILTEQRGWQLFKDLTEDDAVAMLQDGETVFVKPTYHYSAPYKDEMIGFQSEGLDFCVTPDHKLSVSLRNARKGHWDEYRLRKAIDCYGKQNMRVRRAAYRWTGIPCDLPPSVFEWLGFWFAEGRAAVETHNSATRHNCVIITKNDIDYAHQVFSDAKLPYSAIKRKDGVYCFRLRSNNDTKPLIKILAECGKATTKTIPSQWKNAPKTHLKRFIKGYLQGDGSHRADGCICAATSSKQLADDIQEIALRAGMVVNVNHVPIRQGSFYINGVKTKQNSDTYTMTFLKKCKHEPILIANGRYLGWYKKSYSGRVYCVEVPTHIVYVRRNGRAFWCSQTYRELRDTTVNTWLHWFGPRNGMPKVMYTDMSWTYRAGDIDCKVLFRALDRPDDVSKLLSMELTGAYVNEAREVPKGIIDGLDDCVGRYPPLSDGGPTWYGVIMDTNPPDDTHWWFKLAEEEQPENWEFFKQPGGLIEVSDGEFEPNPAAENLANLLGGAEWYRMRTGGKSKDHIRIYYCNQYGFVVEGRPVIPEYIDSIHCPGETLRPIFGHTIYVGLDFGLTPAAVFTQHLPNGRWIWFDEIISESMGIKRFAETELRPKIQGEYQGFDFAIYGDPAGKARAQTDEQTCFDLLRAAGIPAEPAPSNDFTLRREAIAEPLGRLIDGKPGLVVSPKCKITRKGLMGGYCYKQKQVSISGGETQFKDYPEKNRYSHPVEAGGYAMLGAGEGYNLISSPYDNDDDPNDLIQPPSPWAA